MSNLFNQLGGQSARQQGNPAQQNQQRSFASPQDFMNQFQQFRNGFSGNAQEKVQQLLNSGQMSQQQFQQLQSMANQLQRFFMR